MKTIKLLLLALLFTSCSADSPNEDDECHCVKETWFTLTWTVNEVEMSERIDVSSESVDCQNEVVGAEASDDGLFYDVTCN